MEERFEIMERNHGYIPEHKERLLDFISQEIQLAVEGERERIIKLIKKL